MSQLTPKPLDIDGSEFMIGIVAARFNQVYVDALIKGAKEVLLAAGVKKTAIVVERVPGSNELPFGAQLMAESGRFDAIIALGAIISGGTRHDELVADSANMGLQRVALDCSLAVVNGVLVGKNEEQVAERSVGALAKGPDFGRCALEMARMRRNYLNQ